MAAAAPVRAGRRHRRNLSHAPDARRHGPLLAHARSLIDMRQLAPGQLDKLLPSIRQWESAAAFDGAQVFGPARAVHAAPGHGARRAVRHNALAVAPSPHEPPGCPPTNDPLQPLGTSPSHRLQHVGAAGRLHPLRLAPGLPIACRSPDNALTTWGVRRHSLEQLRGPQQPAQPPE